MSRAVLLLVALAGLGWALPWPDQAQAGAALQWLALGGLCVCVAVSRPADRPARLACAAGVGVAAAGAACASMWSVLSQHVGSCDEGTGRPVTAGAALALLAVCAEFLRSRPDDDSKSG